MLDSSSYHLTLAHLSLPRCIVDYAGMGCASGFLARVGEDIKELKQS